MCKMTFLWIILLFFVFCALVEDVISLRNVILTIEPRVVPRFNRSTLRCSYDLEGDALYSVKWYRGRHEFYRFTPSENPSTKTFPIGGITVDMSSSNSTQVVLRNIEFNLSGNFSCEVTTDAPFSTGYSTQSMLVVQLPEYPPTISVGREPLDIGDTLRANCSSSPSRPPAILMFILNNLTVAKSEPLSPRQYQETAWSDLFLEMELSEFYFGNGPLSLRCVAEIAHIYTEEAALKLVSARDPVPERVSASDEAIRFSSQKGMQLFILIISFLLS